MAIASRFESGGSRNTRDSIATGRGATPSIATRTGLSARSPSTARSACDPVPLALAADGASRVARALPEPGW
jgi:hypothetical protein